MTTIHTAYGPGEVVETDSVGLGRKRYKVAGLGFEVWLDEAEVSRRTASEDLFSYAPEVEALESAASHTPGVPEHSEHNHSLYPENGHHVATAFDFEPSRHTWDNSTTLPYDWEPQYPVDMFRHEQTQSPDHEIDLKKRLKDTDSRTGDDREPIHEYPGPNPDLFARDGSYRPAGLSDKYADVHECADHFNNPVVRFQDDPVREIHRHGHIDISAGLDHETGEWMDLVLADKQIRTAAWSDVRQKAMRLKREGRVHIKAIDPNAIYAKVEGDHGDYEVMILKGGSYNGGAGFSGGKQAIAHWKCDCDWGRWAFKRQMTYVGRLCSHGYATYLTQQSALKGDKSLKRAPKRAAIVDDFKAWIKDENGDHIDAHAADTFLSTIGEPATREDAQKVFEYVDGNHSEHPERDYDVKGYHYEDEGPLHHQPGKLNPHLYVVPEGDGEWFTDLGDDRKTTGPDQIQAKVASDGHHPAFAWHAPEAPDFPENGIVHFSRKAALQFTADEGLLNRLRELGEERPDEHYHDCQDHNREVSEVVEELHDRGYDASPLVAMKRQAMWKTADDDDPDGKVDPGFSHAMGDIGHGLGNAWHYLTDSGPGTGSQGVSGQSPSQPNNPNDPGWRDTGNPLGKATQYLTQSGPGTGSQDITPHDSPAPTPAAQAGATAPAGGGTDAAPHAAPGAQAPAATTSQPASTHSAPVAPSPVGGDGPGLSAPSGGDWSPASHAPGSIGTGKDYTVQQGDTLSGIAGGAGLSDFKDLVGPNSSPMSSGTNLGQNPDLIHPGDVLHVPGGGGAGAISSPALGAPATETSATAPVVGATPKLPAPFTPPLDMPGGKTGAQHFAERYFQADDTNLNADTPPESGNDDDKRNKGADYLPISGPRSPVGSPGQQPLNAPRPSGDGNSSHGQGISTTTGPIGGAANTEAIPSGSISENAAASPPGPSNAPGVSRQRDENALGAPGGGGLGGGALQAIMPLISEGLGMIPGIGGLASGLAGGLMSGLGHLGSSDAERYAALYMQSNGDFLTKGGPDWMDHSFCGSGPDIQDWSGTSEDYVDENERPKHQETWRTDNKGDIVRYKSPKQQPKQATQGQLTNTDAISEASRNFWADVHEAEAADSASGYFNPKNKPGQPYDKGDDGLGGITKGKGGGGGTKLPDGGDAEGAEAAGDAAGAGEAAEGAGMLEELAPLLLAASRTDGSDIVRQFHASGGGCLNAPAGNNGQYGDDSIATQAQKLLKTAGRNYTPAEQRELEDEFHPRGARNLKNLDLRGTHYID